MQSIQQGTRGSSTQLRRVTTKRVSRRGDGSARTRSPFTARAVRFWDLAFGGGRIIQEKSCVCTIQRGEKWLQWMPDPSRLVVWMRVLMRSFANSQALAVAATLLPAALLATDVDTKFHNAPASAQAAKN